MVEHVSENRTFSLLVLQCSIENDSDVALGWPSDAQFGIQLILNDFSSMRRNFHATPKVCFGRGFDSHLGTKIDIEIFYCKFCTQNGECAFSTAITTGPPARSP